MATFAVIYTYAEGSDEARAESRPAHIDFLRELFEAGTLYMSGPLPGETPRALLVVQAEDEASVAAAIDDDPFRIEGLVAERDIALWNVFFDPRERAEA